ncbi:unknown protein [Oryza sativa Japonica Group]|uniref:Os01g0888800 protein n=2 Tax=Oryza sativa subsp. japonica TaxID=39947 RepID=A0A0P0VBE1_ORYSJ|nr:protein AUXIN-REGULATED GENE INVOLVED IN ORGAN SIZE [Oryza sativa Japonica Group]KAB8084673.1 hypothetical protein EE612_007279 [Oryza sativa]EAZ14428.1 hypothetical protein OsJ_04349 [Oryza sativa Japonica Group]KAF2953727.1 hypothetical protein DAI22_01g428400 [Oryza sativa Japonica Group]BAB92641.1 unknown protein [Oryza sativa Japonica Group]BAF06956.1 Os01g0888800 [Oryza sativa Japonica Group]|eukprot:NP_001045042.1 Os01g0888800 [Oryza sativa Japonica Group]
MSFAIRSSEPEFWFLIPSEEAAVAVAAHRLVVMDQRRSGSAYRPKRTHMAAAEDEHRRPGTSSRRRVAPTPTTQTQTQTAPGYFTVELVMAFVCVTASLVLLPLVLPPLPPPPSLLLVVPVCLLAVLVAMAFVPLDAQSNVVGSSCL